MKFFCIFFLYIFFSSINCFANEKIVFLDLDYILKESTSGKEILNELENINKKNLKLLDNEVFNLKKKRG